MKKKITAAVMAMLLIAVICACDKPAKPAITESGLEQESSALADTSTSVELADRFREQHFPSNGEIELLNFKKPEFGEEIAVIKTNLGSIKLLFFPEVAPLAVENFKQLATSGYYNGLTFYRVAKDMLIQSGDPIGTGEDRESFTGQLSGNECSEQVLNLRGAVGMVSGAEANQSQFFIIQAPATTIDSDLWKMLEEKKEKGFPKLVKESYEKNGGMPWLDFNSTVFGQVYEGLDIVDAIAKTEVNDNLKPLTDVIVETVTIEPADFLPTDVSSQVENKESKD